ncbi:MAG TPA: SURF1 family protein [Nocardioidaceae bacterium]|nr:SURF1 family protein [Nocardioidaceae bacterium]
MLRVLFSPRLLGLHAAALVAVAAAVLLGLWQYGVWQGHRTDQASVLAHAAPVTLRSVLGPDSAFPADGVGRPVRFTGRWMPQDTLFVSHRPSRGRMGVWAVTPVAVCSTGSTASAPDCGRASAILVVRGWAPSVGAVPAAPRGTVRVQGWLQPGEGSGPPDPDPADRVLTALRVPDAIGHVDRDLYGGYVIAKASSPQPADQSSLTPVTPESLPQPSEFTGLRNLLYSLQWWVFGGFAVFLWWRWTRDALAQRDSADDGSEEGPSQELRGADPDGRRGRVEDAEVTSRT